jgi:hypothetical protein
MKERSRVVSLLAEVWKGIWERKQVKQGACLDEEDVKRTLLSFSENRNWRTDFLNEEF